jgi:hypothetical protein
MNALRATLTRTYRGEPLAVIDGLPGGGAELMPAQLRALAATLLHIAADCESRPAPGKRPLPPVSRDYILT